MSVVLEVVDGVAELRLDRPEAGNAIDREFTVQLKARVAEIEARDDVRVIVLTAAGSSFCVGGDLGYMAAAGDEIEDRMRELVGGLHEGLLALQALELPVIAVVEGPAAGAGLSLVCLADLAIATPNAVFRVAYTAVGLSPDGGLSWTLPKVVGARRAADLSLTNRRVDPDEALAIGIVSEVVEADQVQERWRKLASTLAAGSAPANAAVKRLLASGWDNTLADQLDLETESISSLSGAPNGREGVAAFLEGRRPAFT
jgi:2-(1,2-epoxy-1,2-dihydrophenyl)acetyl-CoA isomerase